MGRRLFLVGLVIFLLMFPLKVRAQSFSYSLPPLTVEIQETLDNGKTQSSTHVYGSNKKGTLTSSQALVYPNVPLFRFPFNHTPFQDISTRPVVYTSDLAAGSSFGTPAGGPVTVLETSIVGSKGTLPRFSVSVPNLTSVGDPTITVTPTLPGSLVTTAVAMINETLPGPPPEPVHQAAIVFWGPDGSVVVDPGFVEPGLVTHFIVTNSIENDAQTLMSFLNPLVGTWVLDHFLNGSLMRSDTVTVESLQFNPLQITPQPWDPAQGSLSINGQMTYAVPQPVSSSTKGVGYLVNPSTGQALLDVGWTGSQIAATTNGVVTGVSSPTDSDLLAFLQEAAASETSASVTFGSANLACTLPPPSSSLSVGSLSTASTSSNLLCPGTYNLVLFAIDPDAIAANYKVAQVVVAQEQIQLQLSPESAVPRWPLKPDFTSGGVYNGDKHISLSPCTPQCSSVTVRVNGAPGGTTQTVRLQARSTQSSGSHYHAQYIRPIGTFVDPSNNTAYVSKDSQQPLDHVDVSVGIGDAGTGQKIINYWPTEFSGQETITATLLDQNQNETHVNGRGTLTVTAPALTDVQADYYAGTGSELNITFAQGRHGYTHTDPNDANPRTNYHGYWMETGAETFLFTVFKKLQDDLQAQKNNPESITLISFNDMTLQNGGKFDFLGQWNHQVCSDFTVLASLYSTPVIGGGDCDQAHRYHRLGDSVDINDFEVGGGTIFTLSGGQPVAAPGFENEFTKLINWMNRMGWHNVPEGNSFHFDFNGQAVGLLPLFPAVAVEPPDETLAVRHLPVQEVR